MTAPPGFRLTAVATVIAVALLAPPGDAGTAPVAAWRSPGAWLPAPQPIAPGVDLFRVSDSDLLSPPGPVAVRLLRLDARRVELRMALAGDQVLGTETVPETARRHGALAAVNAGFFLPSGDPAGVLVLDHLLVSDTTLTRGAVAILPLRSGAPVSLLFDQVGVRLQVAVPGGGASRPVLIDAVDTVRRPGRLVWFTPRFHAHTDTTDAGIEWVLRGTPLCVVERRSGAMRTAIPPDGAVLSFGGSAPPAPLDRLDAGARVDPAPLFTTVRGTSPRQWAQASHIVGGAGLLVHGGRLLDDWAAERLRAGFATERHPRTMIGADGNGVIWLVTVDGRNPLSSLGMRFDELQGLARRLGLRHALNLDGGGSTTMVVRDEVVNRPSDPTGPRKVSDALLVFRR